MHGTRYFRPRLPRAQRRAAEVRAAAAHYRAQAHADRDSMWGRVMRWLLIISGMGLGGGLSELLGLGKAATAVGAAAGGAAAYTADERRWDRRERQGLA